MIEDLEQNKQKKNTPWHKKKNPTAFQDLKSLVQKSQLCPIGMNTEYHKILSSSQILMPKSTAAFQLLRVFSSVELMEFAFR